MNLQELKALPPKEQAKLFKRLSAVRHAGKQAGYSAMYGAAAKTIARSAKIDLHVATKLHVAYWKLNWAIPATCETLTTKTVGGQLWQFNEVSGLWYSLRAMKDQWSTLNQGTGTYCFDMWVMEIKKSNLPIIGQMHDEYIGLLRKGRRKRAIKVTKDAVHAVNEELKLNRELDCSLDFGESYADIH